MAKLQEKTTVPQERDVDDCAADASGSDESETSEELQGNAGWADSIAKVLNTTKPKTKKTLVLSRAKKIKPKDKTIATPQDYGFVVEGEIKEEKPDKAQPDEKSKQKRNVSLSLRMKPSWKDIERERALRKVATKGVVQLFNAVRIQQKDLKCQLDEAGPLDSRKEAVLNNINKRKFLDVLMSGKRAKSEAVGNQVKCELKKHASEDDDVNSTDGKRKSEWNVLRSDFMTNKKIKHWDEEDSDNSAPADGSDSDTEDDK